MNLILQAMGCNIMGALFVYSGVTFMNKVLLTGLLSPVYDLTENMFVRLAVALIVFFAPANLFIAKSYEIAGPGIAGSAYVLSMLLGMVAVALILDGVKINLMIVGGTALAAIGCLIVVNGLKPVI